MLRKGKVSKRIFKISEALNAGNDEFTKEIHFIKKSLYF